VGKVVLFRGPDPSERQRDLTKVERCLQAISRDPALATQERSFRSVYYMHLKDKLSAQPSDQFSSNASESKISDSRPNALQQAGTVIQAGRQDNAKHLFEPWRVITPSNLIRAVANIREDCENAFGRRRSHFLRCCFRDLHPVAPDVKESAVFKMHFDNCVEALAEMLTVVFGRFLRLSLSQDGEIAEAPIEWARLHVTDFIEQEDRAVYNWIKSCCDMQSSPHSVDTTHDAFIQWIFWTDWRAPRWLYMEPNGNMPYNGLTAWERMSEAETRHILNYLREDRWILSLELVLEKLVGTAYEELAKTNSPRSHSEHSVEGDPSGKSGSIGNQFIRRGDVWSITYENSTCQFRHERGLEYIARLLQRNGEFITAVELQLSQHPNLTSTAEGLGSEIQMSRGHLYQDRSDPKALQQYQKRAEELVHEIAHAREQRNENRVETLLDELEAIQNHIKADKGLGGRRRRFTDEAQAARSSVTNAINRTFKRIRNQMPSLADHLEAKIRTGTEMIYSGDGTRWQVSIVVKR
jgi:hypothetical protein